MYICCEYVWDTLILVLYTCTSVSQSANHQWSISFWRKKSRPRCYAKSPTARDMFQPIPGFNSCTEKLGDGDCCLVYTFSYVHYCSLVPGPFIKNGLLHVTYPSSSCWLPLPWIGSCHVAMLSNKHRTTHSPLCHVPHSYASVLWITCESKLVYQSVSLQPGSIVPCRNWRLFRCIYWSNQPVQSTELLLRWR